jgi:hypothetical protein
MTAVLVAAAWISFGHSAARADVTTWSAVASGCVAKGSGFQIFGAYVINFRGGIVELFCSVAPLRGAFDTIEITYSVDHPVTSGPAGDSVLAQLVQVTKATSQKTIKCAVQPKITVSGWRVARNLCNSSVLDFNKYFYYVSITIRDSPVTPDRGVSVGGVSLISTR